MATVENSRAILASMVVALVVVSAGCSAGGVSPPEADPGLSFHDVSENVGLEYASDNTGPGNGRDGVYVTDFNGDYRPDLFVTGGPYPALFENIGGAFERSEALPTHKFERSIRGALFFDADGDIDLAVTDHGGHLRLYESADIDRNWVQFHVEGVEDVPATGATVYVTVDGATVRYDRLARSDYLSQDSRTLHAGFGDAELADSVRVVWPDGTERTFEDLSVNQAYVVLPYEIRAVDAGGEDGQA